MSNCIDPKALKVVASIDLAVEGRGDCASVVRLKRSSGGEGGHATARWAFAGRKGENRRFSLSLARHIRDRGIRSATASRGQLKKGTTGSLLSQSGSRQKTLAKTCADFQ